MAEIIRMESERTGKVTYRVRWRETPTGPKLSKTFKTKAAADSFTKQVAAALDAGTYVEPKRGDVTFEEYATRWAARQRWEETTRGTVRGLLRKDLLPPFGAKKMALISRADIEAELALWFVRYAPSTANQKWTYLRSILKAAVADEVIRRSPATGISIPKPSRRAPLRLLTTDQVFALADAIRPDWRAAVLIGAGAGLRSGEVRALTPGRIDYRANAIRVEAALKKHPKIGTVEGAPKTRSSRRIVPVGPEVLDEITLTLHRLEVEGPGIEGYLFTLEDGAPISGSAWSYWWRKAVAAAGVPKGTRFHDLRHYYASLLIQAGLTVVDVSARLGHASVTETLETYAHLWPSSEDATRQAVTAEWARAQTQRAKAST